MLKKAQTKSAAEQQLDLWNKPGPHVLNSSYSLTASQSWCVVGCVMADAFDPDVHEDAVVNAVKALAQVAAVATPRHYGMTPENVLVNPEPPEEPTHEVVLHATSRLVCQVGPTGDKRSRVVAEHETVNPPVNKQWLVLNLALTGPLDHAGIAQLELDIEAIELAGQQAVTQCEHLIGDTVPGDASNVSLQIESRVRIEEVPPEVP